MALIEAIRDWLNIVGKQGLWNGVPELGSQRENRIGYAEVRSASYGPNVELTGWRALSRQSELNGRLDLEFTSHSWN